MANIPSEFTVSVRGELSGEDFRGVFKAVPLLSHRQNLARDQMRRDLLGPKPEEASADAVNISQVFSKLYAHLTETPSWWKDSGNGLNLLDEAPVAAVYEQVLKIETDARKAILDAGQKAANELKKPE